MNTENKFKICDYLIEDIENLNETVDIVCKYGINLISSDNEVISGYDLLVKYYAGVLTGMKLLLDEHDLIIPDDVLQREMKNKLQEISDGI